jgi:alpha-amylase
MKVTSYQSDKWFHPTQRCGGNIRGVVQQLTYIKELGCNSILLNPFLKNNPESYHGYAIEDFTTPDPDWGTTEEVVELVEKAHQLGLKVYFDVVLNHTGNNWSYKSKQPNYDNGKYYSFDYWRYSGYPQPVSLRNINLYSRKGAIIHWDDTVEMKDGDIFELKDLNTNISTIEGKKTLSILLEIYSYWIEKTKCDGFRIDAAKHVHSEWLNQWIQAIKEYAHKCGMNDFFVFGEYIDSDYKWTSEYKMDGAFDFPLYFFWRSIQEKSKKVKFEYPRPSFKWIRFLDNHDQVGMEPKARLTALWSPEHIKLLWALLLLSPGIPCIYYGTEQLASGKGEHDGWIREPMFNQTKSKTFLNPETYSYKIIQSLVQIRKQFIHQIQSDWEQVEIDKQEKIWNFTWQSKGKYLIICLNMSADVFDLSIENRIFHIKDTKKSVYLYDGEEWKEEKNNALVPPHQIAWSWVTYEKY